MPSSNSSCDVLLERLAADFVERHRRGEHPPLSEYTDRYPDLAADIRDLFPALVQIEKRKPPADATEDLERPATPVLANLERLGDYRILREVGRGGMGVVYEAEQESLGRHVALKVLPSSALLNPTYLARFRREAQAAGRLHHTNIVPVFGVGECDGVHYYAMQFIQGEGLDKVLADVRRLRRPLEAGEALPSEESVAHSLLTGQFNPPTAADPRKPNEHPESSSLTSRLSPGGPEAENYRGVARIGVQVADALAYAHRQGILHRDVKPSNLLLDLQGTVWVADFGLAKAEGTEELTHTGDIVGTIRFMAPERFEGKSLPQSDVYGLGLTLYELLTLRPAFDDTNKGRLIDKVLHEPPRLPCKLDPRVPRDLETLVLKCLAKDPSERYATAEALAEDLRRFLADRPIRARRATAAEQAWRWCRRNPPLAAATALMAVALVAAAVLSLLYADRQRHFALEQTKANRRITDLLAASNRLLAIRSFDRGQAAFEKGEIGPGLLWMVECWKSAVAAGDPDWQRAARANVAAWQPHHGRLQAVLSHESPVAAAAFSPDGKTVLTGGDDGTARLWDAATGRPIGQPIRHEGVVTSVAFSPDGKTILTGGNDKTARLWEAATGQPVGSHLPQGGEVSGVAYSPSGRTILTASNDKMARLWDTATHRPIGQPFVHQRGVSPVAFSADGKTILTGGQDAARLWDAATGKPIGLPLADQRSVCAVAFSPDGKTVLTGTGGSDNTARLWDAATGKPVGEPIRHRQKVRAVAFSPDGWTLLTGSEDKTARLWDAVTNQPIGPPLVHQGPVVAVAFSPDGKSFLTASSDNTVKLWDADPGQPFGLIHEHQNGGKAVAFSPDGKSIFSGDNAGSVKRWDTATGEIIGQTVHSQGSGVTAVAVNP